jgi:cardiolipin synthase A/B
MRSMFAALERGVRVHIVVPKKTDHFAIQHGSIHFLKPLIQHGARVYRYKKGFYHSKLLMTDGRAAYIGSANFDRRSLQSSFEAGLNVYHKETCRRVQHIFNKDVQESDLMTLALLRQRKWWEKAATPLSLLVARWM